jgi:nicotinate-nucleotide pyrophosphorylase (carboxylating)
MDAKKLRLLVAGAISEDVGTGDITTRNAIPSGMKAKGNIKAKEGCVVCGLGVAGEVFRQIGSVEFLSVAKDGDCVKAGQVIARVSGDARSILAAERTALNFLQRLSGIATMTSRMVGKAGKTGALVLDTRKTTPGLRMLEKYAVVCGGGKNHRFGLYDGVLIKDNHIRLVGISEAVRRCRAEKKKVEVETATIAEVSEALDAGADIIMLDNMNHPLMKKAVGMIGKRALVEVSGGVSEKNIAWIAKLGVGWISVGALTHSVRSVDIGMDIEKA